MKLRPLLLLLFFLPFFSAVAQRAEPDQLKLDKGMLTIQPVTHSSVVFTYNNKTIYVDPYGGAKGFAGLKQPDLILITDIHPDHLDPETLKLFEKSGATVVAPPAVAEKLPAAFKKKVVTIKNGGSTKQLGVNITAVPMYNLPQEADSKHPKGRGNGYILNFEGKNVYLSGDTEDTPEMRQLKDIAVAFVCMNLPYTMSVNQAAEGVLAFKPQIVYPYHYRGQSEMSDVNEFKNLVKNGNPEIEVRLREWYPEY